MNWLTNLFGGLFGGGGGQDGTSIGGGNSTYNPGFAPVGMPSKGTSGNYGGQNPLMSMFGGPQGLLGLGISGLGNLLSPKVQAPNLNTPQMQQYQQFTQNPPQLPQGMQEQINNSLAINEEEQLRNLRNVYKNLRPGTDYTTDSTYQRDLANLQRNMASNRSNAMMGPTLQYLQPQGQHLGNQAQMSLYEPMMQGGIDAQKADQQNQLFGDIGSMFMKKGLGMGGGLFDMFGEE